MERKNKEGNGVRERTKEKMAGMSDARGMRRQGELRRKVKEGMEEGGRRSDE